MFSTCRTLVRSLLTPIHLAVPFLCLAIALPSANGTELVEGLLAYWSLDEGAGVTAEDFFGVESDDGNLRNSPTWLDPGDAMFGSALRFNGVDQDVLVSDSFDLDITTNSASVSAWVNIDALPSELVEDFGAIYDSSQDSYILYLDRGNQELRFKVTDEDGTAERPGVHESMLSPGSWHHVLGVYNGEDTAAKIYYDGVRVDNHLNAGLSGGVRTGQIAGIGANPLTDAGNPSVYFFPGAIDDVAVWNRALGQAEATYLYNDGTGNAVGEANPDIAFVPDGTIAPAEPVAPAVDPVVFYRFEGDLVNDGTGGSVLDGTLLDTPGVNDLLYWVGTDGLGLDLRENPDAATGGDSVSLDYELTDSGTIAFDYAVDKFYNYQSLWTNSVEPNDWEMWIYDTGILRARVQDSSVVSSDLNLLGGLDRTYNIAFTWERTGDNVDVNLYVDGVLQDFKTGAWVDPGTTVFIAGQTDANEFGAGIWDNFRVYDATLSAGEVLYLSLGQVCDFDGDGFCDVADIDMLVGEIAAGTHDTSFDLTGDATVDQADLDQWLAMVAEENGLASPYLVGDSDLDGTVNANDLNALALSWQENVATWSGGDFTASGTVDAADLNALAINWQESVPLAAAAVPEPAAYLLMVLGITVIWRLPKKRVALR